MCRRQGEMIWGHRRGPHHRQVTLSAGLGPPRRSGACGHLSGRGFLGMAEHGHMIVSGLGLAGWASLGRF